MILSRTLYDQSTPQAPQVIAELPNEEVFLRGSPENPASHIDIGLAANAAATIMLTCTLDEWDALCARVAAARGQATEDAEQLKTGEATEEPAANAPVEPEPVEPPPEPDPPATGEQPPATAPEPIQEVGTTPAAAPEDQKPTDPAKIG